MIETLQQPNGSTVRIDVWGESMSCYSDEDLKNGYRNTFLADVHVYWPYGSHHTGYSISNKRFYSDLKGIYTYKNQKTPIYYWKPKNVEEDYEVYTKDDNGYSIPLNQPRKIKKNYF